jgi:hypothetical protein
MLEEVVNLELAGDSYRRLLGITFTGGPYSAIYDLSATKRTIHADTVRLLARRALYDQFEVVYSLEEAYDTVEVRPEDFTERLFPKEMAARACEL